MSEFIGMYRLDENKNPVALDLDKLDEELPGLYAMDKRRVRSSSFRVWQKRIPKVGGYRKEPKKLSVWVSTVFLVSDHGFSLNGPPILFETMVFFKGRAGRISPLHEYQRRYATWKQAEEGHVETCKWVNREHLKR